MERAEDGEDGVKSGSQKTTRIASLFCGGRATKRNKHPTFTRRITARERDFVGGSTNESHQLTNVFHCKTLGEQPGRRRSRQNAATQAAASTYVFLSPKTKKSSVKGDAGGTEGSAKRRDSSRKVAKVPEKFTGVYQD